MKALRTGFTTGTCATAAAKAAAMTLCGSDAPERVEISLPNGERVVFAVTDVEMKRSGATASVVKFAGDDPDVTNGLKITVAVEKSDSSEITFAAGAGVGTVTKPGLSIPPGEPAINPTPRRMIREAIREISEDGFNVAISIENGEAIAKKTFNPRLGIVGGLSVLGTSGRVVPYSCPAIRESLKSLLSVMIASGVTAPVFVPGNIGRKAAQRHFSLSEEQLMEVGNEWGVMIDALAEKSVDTLLVVGHPGKLGKLLSGQWDTHSGKSESAAGAIAEIAERLLNIKLEEVNTVEGIFSGLGRDEQKSMGDETAKDISNVISERLMKAVDVAVTLVGMNGDIIGEWGDVSRWRRR